MKKSPLTLLIVGIASMAFACTAASNQECEDQCLTRISTDSVGPVVDTMFLAASDTAFVVGYGMVKRGGTIDTLPIPPGRLIIVRR
jgi:hypothetical protein